MLARVRGFFAVLTITALLTSSTAPAFADSFSSSSGGQDDGYEASVPVVLDVLLLRPLGLLMTAGGIVLYFVPVLPITAVTRPTQIFKPLGPLVATPARYTFGDPLGMHPAH